MPNELAGVGGAAGIVVAQDQVVPELSEIPPKERVNSLQEVRDEPAMVLLHPIICSQ